MRPTVPKETKLLEPPKDVPAELYWERVKELHATGMPWYNATRLSRQEMAGAREIDGPLTGQGQVTRSYTRLHTNPDWAGQINARADELRKDNPEAGDATLRAVAIRELSSVQ